MKLEGNVFTGVCLRGGGDVGSSVTRSLLGRGEYIQLDRYTFSPPYPRAVHLVMATKAGLYASDWNDLLFLTSARNLEVPMFPCSSRHFSLIIKNLTLFFHLFVTE